MFGCLKSRGFCLEETHVTDAERLRKLVALLALAFCRAHAVGEVAGRLMSRPQQMAFARVIRLLSCT